MAMEIFGQQQEEQVKFFFNQNFGQPRLSYLRSQNLFSNQYYGHNPAPTSPQKRPVLCTYSIEFQFIQDKGMLQHFDGL